MNPQIKDIELRRISDDWYGISAKRTFEKRETIEVCPIVILDKREKYFIEETTLRALCKEYKDGLILPGGYGLVYYPSKKPNADYTVLPDIRMMKIFAKRKIKNNEFITLKEDFLVESDVDNQFNKPTQFKSDGLVVKQSPGRGLGTFTTREFKKGEFAEICYLYTLTHTFLVWNVKLLFSIFLKVFSYCFNLFFSYLRYNILAFREK